MGVVVRLEKIALQLDTGESYGFGEAVILENQIKALRDDVGLRKWFDTKTQENNDSDWDDIRVDTNEFLDIIGRAIEGIGENGEKGQIAIIREMIRGLMRVKIDEDESLEDEEQNDCICSTFYIPPIQQQMGTGIPRTLPPPPV